MFLRCFLAISIMKFIYFVGIISFLTVLYITKWLIRYLRRIDLIVLDQNKEDKPTVPVSGGLGVMVGIFAGIMVYIFFRTFFPNGGSILQPNDDNLVLIFAAVISILVITLVGFIDDLLVKKSKESTAGLKQWQKPLLTLGAAIPLMVINAGISTMYIPLIGRIDVGLLYPLLIVPIGVVGAANMVNLLAGLNGLETGLGIIYFGMLGLYAFVNNSMVAALIAFVVFVSLIAFLFYNRVPAKILPGDSLTYLMGGALASIAIIGNMEKAALIISIPFFIEFLLKLRGKFKKQSYGYGKNGKVHSQYKEIYSIPHIFMRTGRFTEQQVVYFVWAIQLFFACLIWFV